MTDTPLIPFAIAVLFRATLVLAVFGAAAYAVRRQPAALRHLIWSLAVAGSVAVPLLSMANPMTIPVLPPPEVATQTVADATPKAPAPVTESRADITRQPSSTSAQPIGVVSGSTQTASVNWPLILLTLWVAGVLAFLLRFASGVVHIRGIIARATASGELTARAALLARHIGVRRDVAVRQSAAIDMPFAFGILNPVIVFPDAASQWTTDRRDAVLMHELAHFRRGDLIMNALSQLSRAIYWFHPLAWLASHRVRVEAERASDDIVLSRGALPSDYAEHLLAIVRSFAVRLPAPALAMARRSEFEGRLLAILEPRKRSSLSSARIALVVAASVVALLPLSALSPTARAAALPVAPRSEPPAVAELPRVQEPTKQEVVKHEPARQESAPAGSAMAALMETLSDANASVRLAAVKSLGSLQDPRAIAALAKALKDDSDPQVREAAAYALGEIDDKRGLPALLDALKVERVAAVRQQIVHALGEIDDPAASAGIAAVSKDASARVRREVAWALGELKDHSSVATLVAMSKDEDTEVRRHVAEALKDMKNESLFDVFAAMAKDADAEVRAAAIGGLGDLEDRRALAPILEALKDVDPEVRSHAASSLDDVPGLKTAPRQLIDALSDANTEVRQNAANTLGNIGDDAAVPALKKATSDPKADVRHAAAEALAEIGGPEAITALMGLLKDSDPEMRKIAAEALGKRR